MTGMKAEPCTWYFSWDTPPDNEPAQCSLTSHESLPSSHHSIWTHKTQVHTEQYLFQVNCIWQNGDVTVFVQLLTHWGRVTHICVGKLTIIGSDNGLSPARRQAIICTNAWILLIGPLGTNFSDILIGIQTFSFTKTHLKMSSAKWRPFCLGLNVLSPLTYLPAWSWSHTSPSLIIQCQFSRYNSCK